MFSRADTREEQKGGGKFISIIQKLEDRVDSGDTSHALFFFRDEAEAIAATTPDAWSWSELRRRSRAIAYALHHEWDLAPGSRVLLVYPSGLGFIAAFVGCLYAGVVPVPVPPPRRSDGLNRWLYIARDAGVSSVLTVPEFSDLLDPLAQEVSGKVCLTLQAADPSIACDGDAAPPAFVPGASTLAFLQYTSGSTSDPKGVMISHGNLMANVRQISLGYQLTARDRMVSWLPHYHDMGLVGGILSPIYEGYSVAMMSPAAFLRRPLRFLSLASWFRATLFGGPNFSYEHCVRRATPDAVAGLDLSALRIAFTGAEAIRADTLARFHRTFAPSGFRSETYLCCYGMAEATLFITGIGPDEPAKTLCLRRDGLVAEGRAVPVDDGMLPPEDTILLVGSGRAVTDLELAIVDPIAHRRRAAGAVGEIWVRGPNISAGYWAKPQASADSFGLALEGTDGWFRTGDLGFLDAFDQLYVTGRLKDIIIIRGENHSPQDIEQTVMMSHAALAEGNIGAVALEERGEECLGLVCEVSRQALRELDPSAVFEAVRAAVSRYHDLQIAKIALIRPGSLPRTPSGKVRRFACRTGLQAESLPAVAIWRAVPEDKALVEVMPQEVATTRPSWREELLALPQARRQAVLLAHLREEAGRLAGLSADHLPSVNAGFFDLGLDSMAVVSFGAAIERELGIRAPGTLLFEYPTLAALCGHLVDMVAGAAAAPQPAFTAADTTTDRVSAVEPDALAAEIAALERVLKGSAQTDRRSRASRTRFTRAGG